MGSGFVSFYDIRSSCKVIRMEVVNDRRYSERSLAYGNLIVDFLGDKVARG